MDTVCNAGRAVANVQGVHQTVYHAVLDFMVLSLKAIGYVFHALHIVLTV